MSKYLQNSEDYIRWLRTALFLDKQSLTMKPRVIIRGSVYRCDFGINIGSEQEGSRPCVVLQNRNRNISSPNTIVAPITHAGSVQDVVVPIITQTDANGNIILDGYALLGNIVTVSKARLGEHITDLSISEMEEIDRALAISVDLQWKYEKLVHIIEDKDEYIAKLKDSIVAKDKEIERLEAINK